MRFPDIPPLPISNAERTDLGPTVPVAPALTVGGSAVNPGALGPATGPSRRRAKRNEQWVEEGNAALTRSDRRRVCRRINKSEDVLLDTRTGFDRRKENRRDEDPVTGVSKQA